MRKHSFAHEATDKTGATEFLKGNNTPVAKSNRKKNTIGRLLNF